MKEILKFIRIILKKSYTNWLVLKDEIFNELSVVVDEWDRGLYRIYKSIKSFFREAVDAFSTEKKLARYFDHTGRTKYNMRFDIFIIFLIFISSIMFIMRLYNFSPTINRILFFADASIIFIFTIEFFLRNLFSKNRSKYFFSIYNIIDFVVVFSFWIGFSGVHFLRVFRVLKIFRFFPKYFSNKNTSTKVLNRIILFKALSVFSIFIFVFSSLFYYAEHVKNSGINFYHDALYFTFVTVTTVGYGDISPVTGWGKTVVIFMVVLAIFLFPVYITSLIKNYISQKNIKKTTCVMCGLKNHDENAVYCKMCGTSIYQEYDDHKH